MQHGSILWAECSIKMLTTDLILNKLNSVVLRVATGSMLFIRLFCCKIVLVIQDKKALVFVQAGSIPIQTIKV